MSEERFQPHGDIKKIPRLHVKNVEYPQEMVFDKRLTEVDRLVFWVVSYYGTKEGKHCFASNKYISNSIGGVSENRVSIAISLLQDLGYIKRSPTVSKHAKRRLRVDRAYLEHWEQPMKDIHKKEEQEMNEEFEKQEIQFLQNPIPDESDFIGFSEDLKNSNNSNSSEKNEKNENHRVLSADKTISNRELEDKEEVKLLQEEKNPSLSSFKVLHSSQSFAEGQSGEKAFLKIKEDRRNKLKKQEQIEKKKDLASRTATPVSQQIIDHWNSKGNEDNHLRKPRQTSNEKISTIINQVLKGTYFSECSCIPDHLKRPYSVEEIIKSIDNYAKAALSLDFFPKKKDYLKAVSLGSNFFYNREGRKDDLWCKSPFLNYLFEEPKPIVTAAKARMMKNPLTVAITDGYKKVMGMDAEDEIPAEEIDQLLRTVENIRPHVKSINDDIDHRWDESFKHPDLNLRDLYENQKEISLFIDAIDCFCSMLFKLKYKEEKKVHIGWFSSAKAVNHLFNYHTKLGSNKKTFGKESGYESERTYD